MEATLRIVVSERTLLDDILLDPLPRSIWQRLVLGIFRVHASRFDLDRSTSWPNERKNPQT